MRKLVYTNVEIEGFQSFGNPVSVPLDRVGVNLIKGSNGVGKSTLINAICWCEYGYNPKKSLETWKDNRPESYRGVRVIVDRHDGSFDYRVARHYQFKGKTLGLTGGSSLMLFIKSKEEPEFNSSHLCDGLHKSDIQEAIIKTIGLDKKSYLNSVIFGQRVLGLISNSNADKRKLFEQIFDVSFVELAKDKAKDRYNELTTQLADIGTDTARIRGVVGEKEKYLADQQALVDQFESNKQKKISQLQEELVRCSSNLDLHTKELETLQSDISDLLNLPEPNFDTDSYNEAKGVIKGLSEVFVTVEGQIDDYSREVTRCDERIASLIDKKENLDTSCPTCSRRLKQSDIDKVLASIDVDINKEHEGKSHIVNELEKLKTDLDQIRFKKEKSEAEFDQLADSWNKYYDALESYKSAVKNLPSMEGDAKALAVRVESVNNEIASLNKRIEDARREDMHFIDLDALAAEIQILKDSIDEKELEFLSTEKDRGLVEWWLKKGFGSSGLKSFVFNAMLTNLNQYIKVYSSRLGIGVRFSIDMNKDSKPFVTTIYRDDQVLNYEDLSGGQKQRVDLCLAFAMHDLISHSVDINLFVTDEGMEGLDNAGIEAVFDLLRLKAENKSVYVVTHSDIIDGLNCSNMYLSLDDLGNTVING